MISVRIRKTPTTSAVLFNRYRHRASAEAMVEALGRSGRVRFHVEP